jgi:hypothetical protein
MIQEAVIAAMQAGLGLPGGADELAALGVRPAAISALASLSPKQRNQLRGRVVLRINIDFAALTGHMCESAATGMIQRGASNKMLMDVLGLSRVEIAAQRAALGAPAPSGRTPLPSQEVRERITAVYAANAALPRAERLMATHDAASMYTLAQIWAIVGT